MLLNAGYWLFMAALIPETRVKAQQPTFEELSPYNTQNLNESLIESVLAQNVQRNNTNGPPPCQSCINREEQKRRRIQVIKKRIVHALRMDEHGFPNITNNRVPQVPSYQRLEARYFAEMNRNMQADAPYDYQSLIQDEEEEFGRTERTYTFATGGREWSLSFIFVLNIKNY